MADRATPQTTEPAALLITVRYYGAARAATGISEEVLPVPPGSAVRDVIEVAIDRHGSRLAVVDARCSYLLDAAAVHGPAEPVADGSVLDVLPPFAGG